MGSAGFQRRGSSRCRWLASLVGSLHTNDERGGQHVPAKCEEGLADRWSGNRRGELPGGRSGVRPYGGANRESGDVGWARRSFLCADCDRVRHTGPRRRSGRRSGDVGRAPGSFLCADCDRVRHARPRSGDGRWSGGVGRARGSFLCADCDRVRHARPWCTAGSRRWYGHGSTRLVSLSRRPCMVKRARWP